MKAKYEAVAVRYVHDVLTGEFLNIGVVVMCHTQGFLRSRFISQWTRVTDAFCNADKVHLVRVVAALQSECASWMKHEEKQGTKTMFPDEHIGTFLRRVVPDLDGAIQFSPVAMGLASDLEVATEQMFVRYVTKHSPTLEASESRTDEEIWQRFAAQTGRRKLLEKLRPHELVGEHFSLTFESSWVNGVVNVVQSISLDMKQPRDISEKSVSWFGKVKALTPKRSHSLVSLLVGLPPSSRYEQFAAANKGIALLRESLVGEAEIYTEEQGELLLDKIEHDLATHPQQENSPPSSSES